MPVHRSRFDAIQLNAINVLIDLLQQMRHETNLVHQYQAQH